MEASTPSGESAARHRSERSRTVIHYSPLWLAVARGTAQFVGLLCLADAAADLVSSATEANFWWIDLRPIPPVPARALLALTGTLLLMFSLRGLLPAPIRIAALCLMLLLSGFAIGKVIPFYQAASTGGILPNSVPVPFALHVALCLLVVTAGLCTVPTMSRLPSRDLILGLGAFAVCAISFPLGQMFCSRLSPDTKANVSAILVFGCRTFGDGTASPNVRQRVDRACDLANAYPDCLLVLAGGPGDGDEHQTDTMHRLCVEHGMDQQRLVDVRSDSDQTEEMTRAAAAVCREHRWSDVVAVSQFWHFPRLRLSLLRHFRDIPIVTTGNLRDAANMEFVVAEEVLALWGDYMRPVGHLANGAR